MSVFLRLQQACRNRLATQLPTLALRYYGVPADRPTAGAWCEERLVPLAPDHLAGGLTQHRAQYRLTVSHDGGADALRTLAASVRAAFPPKTAIVATPETWVVTTTAETDRSPGPGQWLGALITIDLLTHSETP